MLANSLRGTHILYTSMALSFAMTSVVWAGATLDGTTGAGTGSYSGNFIIPDTVGETHGSNLFHSFSDFSIDTGESATFTGPDVIDNVLTRVTGNTPSTFNGALNSAIPSANFYFINPNGIIFKEGAQINVDGSFYASTGNYINLGQDGVFHADPNASTLTSSPPAAFGFLEGNPGQITLEGTQLVTGLSLNLPFGASLSLIGGDITLEQSAPGAVTHLGGFLPNSTGSFISPTGNRFELVSVASGGEAVSVNGVYDLSSFSTLGNVMITGGSIIDATDVYIHGGNITISEAMIAPGYLFLAGLSGPVSGGNIDITATEQVSILGTAPINTFAAEFIPRPDGGPYISGITTYGGSPVPGAPASDAANININGGNVTVSGVAAVISERLGPGVAGDINITGETVEIRNGAFVANINLYEGAGGNITVEADQVILDGEGDPTGLTGLNASSNFNPAFGNLGPDLAVSFNPALANGDAGTVTVTATGSGGLTIKNGASISTESRAFGKAGDIVINTTDATLSRDGMAFGAIASQSAYAGDAGDITVHATGDINIESGFEITGSIEGTGNGGSVSVTADNSINISGENSGIASATIEPSDEVKDQLAQRFGSADFDSMIIDLNNFAGGPLLQPDATLFDALAALQLLGLINLNDPDPSAGDAGTITATAATLNMDDASRITSSTSDNGNGGIINVQVDTLAMTNDAEIRSRTGLLNEVTGNLEIGTGDGGSINIMASDSISMSSGSSISASSLGDGTAGNISVNAGNSLDMNNSSITSQAEGAGDGGNISVAATSAVNMTNSASISASSLGAGLAGNISINAGQTLNMSGSSITTQAVESDGGNISLVAVDMIYLDQSEITTSVESGVGGGGNIDIDPEFVILKQSNILANAYGGPGGNINIVAGNFIATPDSTVDASSALGIDGTVNIRAPDETVSEDLAVLPDNYLDVTSLMSDRCGTTAGASSLVDAGPGGRTVDPDGYLPSFAATTNNNEEKSDNKSSSKGSHWWSSYTNKPGLQLAQMTCTF